MIRKKLIAGVIGSLALVAQVSGASFSDLVNGYNVVTFGDFTSENEQIHGALSLAADGDVSIASSYGFGVDIANSRKRGEYTDNTIVASGNVELNGSGHVWGNVISKSSVVIQNTNEFTVEGKIEIVDDLSRYFNFASVKEELNNFSNYIAEQEAIAGVVEYSTLVFRGVDGATENYFVVDASEFENTDLTAFKFENVSENSKVFVTVTGENVNYNINSVRWGNDDARAYAENILWNFADAEDVKLGGSVIGSVLALGAKVQGNGNGGQMDGTLVSGEFGGLLQFHYAPFTGDVPEQNVPESSTVTMVLIGACALMFTSRKKVALLRK
ncbi:MAG: choice-of-anchor A family protein [Fibrobacter sp.]|nr:choice-of-anchor A family protein [Fibrobacter sp.]